MPPKKQQTKDKTKKAVEDKTFGMKNKNKSAKVQKYVQQVQQQAAAGGKNKVTVRMHFVGFPTIHHTSSDHAHVDREAEIEGGTGGQEGCWTEEEGRASWIVQACAGCTESSIWYWSENCFMRVLQGWTLWKGQQM